MDSIPKRKAKLSCRRRTGRVWRRVTICHVTVARSVRDMETVPKRQLPYGNPEAQCDVIDSMIVWQVSADFELNCN